MAGRYTKQELKVKLHRSAFHLVATEGLGRLTTRKLSAGCGLSEPYIYQCYSDIPELIEDAFMDIDQEIADLMQKLIQRHLTQIHCRQELGEACWLLWCSYWNYLMEDAEKTVFYWRYYQSGYYTKELLSEQQKNFSVFIDFIKNEGAALGFSDIAALNAIIAMIIDGSVSMAVKIHLGYIAQEAVSAEDIYHSIFSLLFHKFGLDIWEMPSVHHTPEQFTGRTERENDG